MSSINNIPDLISYPESLGSEVAQGQHYMLIDSYESKSAVDKEGAGTRKSSIALYIPPGSLTTTIGQNYEGLKGGATLVAGAGVFGVGGQTSTTMGSFVSQGLQGLLSKPQAAADFNAAARGLARNNHMALVYRGPNEFRTHTFNFSFWPKNKTEADIVKEIIADFQKGSTPRMKGLTGDKGSVTKLMTPYFGTPRHWEIKFCKGGTSGARSGGQNDYLFKIQRSVITTMTINHDPDSVIGFHKDGSPVHSTLAITFQEIQYILSDDLLSGEHQKLMDKAEAQAMSIAEPEAGSSVN